MSKFLTNYNNKFINSNTNLPLSKRLSPNKMNFDLFIKSEVSNPLLYYDEEEGYERNLRYHTSIEISNLKIFSKFIPSLSDKAGIYFEVGCRSCLNKKRRITKKKIAWRKR